MPPALQGQGSRGAMERAKAIKVVAMEEGVGVVVVVTVARVAGGVAKGAGVVVEVVVVGVEVAHLANTVLRLTDSVVGCRGVVMVLVRGSSTMLSAKLL